MSRLSELNVRWPDALRGQWWTTSINRARGLRAGATPLQQLQLSLSRAQLEPCTEAAASPAAHGGRAANKKQSSVRAAAAAGTGAVIAAKRGLVVASLRGQAAK